MENSRTKELLTVYYNGFAQKQGWESVIADDFKFFGDMTYLQPAIGKQAYIAVIRRFSQAFEAMHVRQMIIQNDQACVIGNYDFIFPNGKKVNSNVAEIWTVKNDQLNSLAIFFDTLLFDKNDPKK